MIEFQEKRCMIVVAHPDDEILGLGASMNKLITEYNTKIHVVILGEGITSRDDIRDLNKRRIELENHKKNIEEARRIIGYQSVSTYNLPDNRFDTIALLDIIKIIESEKNQFKPETIFTHHGGDVNIDHQKTFQAVVTACRPVPNEKVKQIITFETMSGTEWQVPSNPFQFKPNLFMEFGEENLTSKCKAMEAYKYEARSYPHPRSTKSLKVRAEMWGTSIGKKYAEAFQINRKII